MQPLAIQQLSSPIDSGDAGSAGTPQSNNGGGVVFNEMMSAARVTANERRATDEVMAVRRAAEQAKSAQEDRDAEHAVAALSAAAQFAANNVRLKQRAAAEQLSHEEDARRAPETKATAQQSAHTDNPTPQNEPAATASEAIQELSADQTAAENAPAPISPQTDPAATQNKDTPEPGDADPLTGQASTLSASHEEKDSNQSEPHGGNLTATQPTNIPRAPSLTDQFYKTVEADQPPTKFEKKGVAEEADVPDINDQAMKPGAISPVAPKTLATDPDTFAQPKTDSTEPIALHEQQADAATQDELDHKAVNENDESEPPVAPIQQPQVAQTSDPSAIAALVATPEIKNSNSAQVKTDPVLAPARSQNSDQAIFPDKGSIAKDTSHQFAYQNAENAAVAVVDRDGRRHFATEAREIRSVSKFDSDATANDTETYTALTGEMEQTGSAQNEGRSQLQKANDQGLITALKTKTVGEPDLRANINPKNSESVSLGELEKLGVKEFSLRIEPAQTTPAPTPELQAPPAAPTQTQPQITGTMTPSSSPNTERRTIAADIRLRALERMVVAAARAGTDTLTLQLYPPALGQVMIRLVMDGQRLRIVTRAANAEAVNTLKDMEGDIRDALTLHGLDLADFDVSDESLDDDDAQRQQSPAPARQTSSGKKNETFIVDLNA